MPKNDVEASYKRDDTPDGAVFTVIPAAYLDVLSATGLPGLVVKFAPYFLSVALTFEGLTRLDFQFIFVGLAIGGAYFAWNRSPHHKKKRERLPQLLIVNSDGIKAQGRSVASKDIKELLLRIPGDVGVERTERVVDTSTAHGAAFNAGANAGLEVNRRRYALMARLKSSSEPVILVERLTPYVGQSLMDDVWEAMRA